MMTPLQTLQQVAKQSDVIANMDPHGIIVSTVSIVAVFLSLLILFLIYLLIGKCVRIAGERYNKTSDSENTPEVQEKASINTTPAANMITINRRPKVMIRIREDISRIGMTAENNEGSMDVRNSSKEKGVIISPLPGVMTGIKVNVGDKVSIGTELAVLEAMKMENSIESEHEGIVTDIYISKGDSVLEGTPLMKIQ